MQDSFERNIDYLRLSVTDSCNYRCIYCMDKDGAIKKVHQNLLSIDELINISQAAIDCGIKKIRLTGGEPLIRPGILDLCSGIKALDGLDELVLTTNGALLKNMAADLKASGVDRINVSLDTLNEDKFNKITRTGCLSDVLDGIEVALKAGFKDIKINVVLINGLNDDEVNDFANLTTENPLNVRFIELMPIGPCMKWDSSRFISTDTVKDNIADLIPVKKNGVADIYKKKGAVGTIGFISPISHRFCNECNRIRVTSDGRILPCLHSDMEYKIKDLSRQEIANTIRLAVKNKPKEHHIDDKHISENKDYMHKIGG